MAGKQGFASMTKEKVQQIARKGGIMAHLRGVAHEWTVKEAAIAGRKGGLVKRSDRVAYLSSSSTRDLA